MVEEGIFGKETTFEIFFHDLNDDAKKRLLEFMELKNQEEGNLDLSPLGIIERGTWND